MTKIKEEVIGLITELFWDKCPYIKETLDSYYEEWGLNPAEDHKEKFRDIFEDFCRDYYGEPEWTILTEILPAEIKYRRFWYNKLYNQCVMNKKLHHYISYSAFAALISSGNWQTDFWQALYTLLEAIQNLPDREQFKFEWGQ